MSEQRPEGIGAARMVAATTVASQSSKCASNMVIVYRTLELCANAVLPAGMCWLVDPCAMAPLFFVFWYVPAAWRTQSFKQPVLYPLLCFIVDDVSLLGLHPQQRHAAMAYGVHVLRVTLLLAIVPLRGLELLPQGFEAVIVNYKAEALFYATASQAATVHMAELWLFCGQVVLGLSLTWAIVTIPLLASSVLRGEQRAESLRSISELTAKIEGACKLEPKTCRAELVRLRVSHKGLVLANLFNTVGPAWTWLLHLIMDIGNVVTLAMHGSYTLAAPLALSLVIAMVYRAQTFGGPMSLYQEVLLTWRRGIATDGYLGAVRGDKGALRIPETVLKVYALPFVTKGLFSVLMAIGAILGNVLVVAKFVFTEWDLGAGSSSVKQPVHEKARQ